MVNSLLEEQLIEKIRGLDDAQKRRVLDFVEEEFNAPSFSWDHWVKRAEAFEAKLAAEMGEDFTIDAASLINEIREERLDDLLGGS